MSKMLHWGILGMGRIAGIFARGLAGSQTGKLIAVGSRTQENADAFGERWQVPHRHGSYEALLADPEVEAIYISTPHPLHAEWAIKAAEVGKHILCEKPLALNAAEVMAIIEAAESHDVFLMEAFMYRCHPQTAKLVELIRSGIIGDVRVIQASFSFSAPVNPESRLFNNALGGGGILDVGCYAVSMARLLAGAATGKSFLQPTAVKGAAHLGELSHVDEYAVAILEFPGDILAQVQTGVHLTTDNVVRIFGSKGSIFVPDPWTPAPVDGVTRLFVRKQGVEETEEILIQGSPSGLYAMEADTVAAYIDARQAPVMTWADSLGNMETLDSWRESIGLVYDAERPENQLSTVTRRPLTVRPESVMKYGQIEGVSKPISRLVMGADNQRNLSYASVMFDDFFERGGNCFDTAYIYGGGKMEKLLGQWVKNRNLREQVVILDKGAHTPHCNPVALTRQLFESLDRLQMDYVDIYMMHRDNPEIPVGEFISVLNEHKDAGRIHIFGASNWSIERVVEANAWAAAHGMSGFSAMSNNFSLARMVEPPWKGCIATSDAQSRAWFTEKQMPLMPWSSQARGFFTGRAHPDDHSDPELVRCWYSDDNFRRLERVTTLAQQRGVLPINIALAYVLSQPFPTFPLIGPRALSETRTSFPALQIELTSEELRWLNLED